MNPLSIGQGHVHHSRQVGAVNSFRYPTFFLYFRCSDEADLKNLLRSKFHRLLSFSAKDYLKGSAGSLDSCVKIFLNETCNYQAEEVWLHTLPRMLGYAFNPVTFWMCHKAGKLDAVLVEVNNTFGERHFYWINPTQVMTSATWFKAEKVFHVSPFFPVEGFYQFRFQVGQEYSRIDINYHDPLGPLRLATWVSGNIQPLQNQSALGLFVRYGWITPMVVLRIHYQAFKLWIKKSKFYRKPALPRQEVSS